MLKTVFAYLWGSSIDSTKGLTLEEAYNTLKNENETKPVETEEVDDESSNYMCYRKTGTVTSVTNEQIIIDELYAYNETEKSIAVGTKVSFMCYTVKNTVCISNVIPIDNEWNCAESETKSKWCDRNVIGNVVKREGRNIIVDPGDIIINLNKVSSEFIPIIGDWLELHVKSEIDENITDLFGNILDIISIRPLKPQVLEGIIRTWDSALQCGTINFNIFFNREALCAGYIPTLRDKVIIEIIESDQGKCNFRALKVVPTNKKFNPVLSFFASPYETEHNEIIISGDISLEYSAINESMQFVFEITNLKDDDIILTTIIIENLSNQSKILDSFPKCIKSKETVNISGECVVRTAGYSKELLIFSFNECKIGRWINISIKTVRKSGINHSKYTREDLVRNTRKLKDNTNKVIIRGPKPFVPARFIPYRLPGYDIPSKLWEVFFNLDDGKFLMIEDLKSLKPVLNHVLSYQNYEERFHTLLYLEEINSVIEMRKFDRDQACLIPNGEYLMLEYENLSEQRPSIVVGDSILLRYSLSNEDTLLEGYIFNVTSKHVYAKFQQRFHEDYKGDDCNVTVVQSRSQIRRTHQAISLAVKNLGRIFLFPTQLQIKEPQINFTYDEYKDIPIIQLNNKKNKSPKRLSNSELMKILSNNNETLKKLNTSNESEDIVQESKLNLNDDRYHNVSQKNIKKKFKLDWFDKGLNYHQKEAVRHILLGEARPLPYFIFGPPGTGKTVTLVETILQILRMLPSRILVAAPSNSAANLICLRLINSGVLCPGDLVRLVSYKAINDNAIPAMLAPYCATANIGADGTSSTNRVTTPSGLTLGCNSKTIGKHRITVGTCTNLGVFYSLAFPRGHFTHIIVDEAGQATEPEIMIPLSFLDILTGQCVLAGDPMQLGPVVCSKYANEFGLCEPFMERILNRFPYVRDTQGFQKSGGYDPRLVTKLLYNYRSLPGILDLPNSMFYHSELLPAITSDNNHLTDMLVKFKDFLPKGDGEIPPSFVFHGVQGENFQVNDSPSWYNPHEISQVFYYINELYRIGCSAKDIGIITPYSKQTKELRIVFTEAEFDVPKIGTVEEFQGQEFKVIILSTVRSTESLLISDKYHNLGFISQPKRLNVALTRAQVLTIVIGNPYLLVHDSSWRYIIKYAVENGFYCGCNIPESFYKS